MHIVQTSIRDIDNEEVMLMYLDYSDEEQRRLSRVKFIPAFQAATFKPREGFVDLDGNIYCKVNEFGQAHANLIPVILKYKGWEKEFEDFRSENAKSLNEHLAMLKFVRVKGLLLFAKEFAILGDETSELQLLGLLNGVWIDKEKFKIWEYENDMVDATYRKKNVRFM